VVVEHESVRNGPLYHQRTSALRLQSMATYNPAVESGIDYEPHTQIRCVECGYVHTDDRFTVCRECGAQL
jgi:rRNA maturation endonuclease Nob1